MSEQNTQVKAEQTCETDTTTTTEETTVVGGEDADEDVIGGGEEGNERHAAETSIITRQRPMPGDRIWLRFVGDFKRNGTQTQHVDEHVRVLVDSALMNAMNTFARHVGHPMASLRFLYDGRRLEPDMSARYYKLEDEDQIDVFYFQYGGATGTIIDW